MNERSLINLLPWVAVAGLGYILWVRKPDTKPDDNKPTTVSVSKTLDACYKADRASKLDILKQVAKASDKTDEQKLQLFNSESEKKRQADFRPYVEIVADALVNGTVDDLAKRLEAGK